MHDVSIRELRNHGGDVVDRVERGEVITITRSGKPVAELRPIRRPRLTAAQLIARCRRLPDLDLSHIRADIDALIDTTLW